MIRTLTSDDFDALFAAFQSAFSDYVVKFSPTREQLAEMFTRRGWVPELSVGAFEEGEMVAFTVNGIDGEAGYDTGTGVIPSHRRHGLARQLMERSIELLRDHGCTRYVLEVIDTNTRAADLYRSLGFETTRGLQSWTYSGPAGEEGKRLADFTNQESFADVAPSWQNFTSSIARAKDPHVVLGDDDSYAVVFPGNGDLAQLAVRPEARRRGVGTRLLRSAAAVAGKPLRIMNVDERDAGIAHFLEACGATRIVRQLEMVRPLR